MPLIKENGVILSGNFVKPKLATWHVTSKYQCTCVDLPVKMEYLKKVKSVASQKCDSGAGQPAKRHIFIAAAEGQFVLCTSGTIEGLEKIAP